jgi:formate dehydrogenase subunit gamma
MATSAKDFGERGNPIDKFGRTVVHRGELLRHTVYTRFLHWMVGIFFFLALLTGFGIYLPWIFRWFTPLLGGGPTTRMLHPWFGCAFVLFFGLQFLNWKDLMRWTDADTRWMKDIKSYITHGGDGVEAPDVGFFNAGQKAQFWEIVVGCILFVITGIIMWLPEIFGRGAVAVAYVIHDISALIMLAGIFVHVYLSTIGEPHTFQSMTKGTVREDWAWTHHPAWFKRVTGRDPRAALEEKRKRLARESDLEP